MSGIKTLPELKVRLANYYLDVVNRAIENHQLHALDDEWLQIKNLLEFVRCHFDALKTTYRDQQWKSILGLTLATCQTNGYASVRGHWKEAKDYLEGAIQVAEILQDAQNSNELTLAYARILYRLGEIDTATEKLKQTLHTLQNESKVNEQTAVVHEQLGMIAILRGEYKVAKSHFDKSLQIRIELDAPRGLEHTYIQLGNLAVAEEKYDIAFTYTRQVQRIQEKQNAPPLNLAHTLRQLSKISLLQQTIPEAREYSEHSLKIARKYGDQHGIAGDLTRLGILSLLENDLDQAQIQLDESLQIRSEIGDEEGKITTLDGLSEVAYKKGNLAKAQSFYQRSVCIAKKLKAPKEYATATYQMGTLVYFDDDFGEAWKLYEQSLTSLEELGTLPLSWRAHREKHNELQKKRKEYTHQLAKLKNNPVPLWHSTYPHRGWVVGAGVGWWVSAWLIKQNTQFVAESDLVTYLVGCFVGAALGLLLGIFFKMRERRKFAKYIQEKLDSFQEMEAQSLGVFPRMGNIKPLDIIEQHLQFLAQEMAYTNQLMLSEEDTHPWLDLYEPYGAVIGFVIGVLFCIFLGWPIQNLAAVRFAVVPGLIGYVIGNRYKAHKKRQLSHADDPAEERIEMLSQDDLDRLQIISDRNRVRIVAEVCEGQSNSLWSYEDQIIHQIDQLEETGDIFLQAIMIRNLADIAFKYKDYNQARYFYQRSLSLMQTLNNHEEIARILHQLGDLAYCSSKFEKAQKYYTRSLKMRQELDGAEGIITTLSHLARLAVRIEEYETAKEKYQRCLALQESRNDLVGLMQSCAGMSVVARRLSDLVGARKLSERHLAIATELEDKEETSLAYASLAQIANREGKLEETAACLQKSIELSGDSIARAIETLNLAFIYAQQKRFKEAVELLEFVQLNSLGLPAAIKSAVMKLSVAWQDKVYNGFWGQLKLYYHLLTRQY